MRYVKVNVYIIGFCTVTGKKTPLYFLPLTLRNTNPFSKCFHRQTYQQIFGRPFVKRFALCYQTVVCLSCLPVCNVGVLWPNGWMDQDETWHAGRPLPQRGTAPQFSALVCCGQMPGWIKMPLGMAVGLGPSDFVLDGNLVPVPQFSAHVHCDQTAG